MDINGRSQDQLHARTMVLELLLPEGMYEVAFEVIRRMLEKRSIATFLADLRVAFA